MPEWLEGVVLFAIIGAPFVLAGLLTHLIRRWHNRFLDLPLNITHFVKKVVFMTVAPRDFLVFAAWMLSLYWAEIFLTLYIPKLPVACILVGIWLWRKFRKEPLVPSSTQEVVRVIGSMIEGVNDAQFHLERLSAIIKAKEDELGGIKMDADALKKYIEQKLPEAEGLRDLTQAQRNIISEEAAQAASKALRHKTTLDRVSFVVANVVLNLAATVIWTLLGSPGQENFLGWFNALKAVLKL